MDKWKVIPDFDDYEVSSSGLVRSNKFNRTKILKPRYLRGYVRYVLYGKNKPPTHFQIHRLVWAVFVGPIKKGLQINHLNGIKDDNRLENLEVVTLSENLKHRYRELGMTGVRGSKSNFAKLTETDVIEIRVRLANNETHTSIAKAFHISRPTISLISERKTWLNVP